MPLFNAVCMYVYMCITVLDLPTQLDTLETTKGGRSATTEGAEVHTQTSQNLALSYNTLSQGEGEGGMEEDTAATGSGEPATATPTSAEQPSEEEQPMDQDSQHTNCDTYYHNTYKNQYYYNIIIMVLEV